MGQVLCPEGCTCGRHTKRIRTPNIVICGDGCTCGRHTFSGAPGIRRPPRSEEFKANISKQLLGRSNSKQHSERSSKGIREAWARGAYDTRERRTTEQARSYLTGGVVGSIVWNLLEPVGYVREFTVVWGPNGHTDKYKLDFAHPFVKVNIELDGPYHLFSKDEDALRDSRLRELGWKVIRVRHS